MFKKYDLCRILCKFNEGKFAIVKHVLRNIQEPDSFQVKCIVISPCKIYNKDIGDMHEYMFRFEELELIQRCK